MDVVRIKREKEDCVKSWAKRPSLKHYSLFSEMTIVNSISIAEKYYDFCNKTIDIILTEKTNHISLITPIDKNLWKNFCNMVNETDAFEKSYKVLTTKHNAS